MANRYWVGGDGSWSDTAHWSSTDGPTGNPPQTVPGSGDAVILNANAGAGSGQGSGALITVDATVNVTSITMGAFVGTLDFATNDNNVTAGSVIITGTGNRRLDMGDGTWTLTGIGGNNIWDATTTTNLTFNANGSTIAFTGNGSPIFPTGALTYNVVTAGPATASGNVLTISGTGATIATFNITAPRAVRFPASGTTTITNAPTWTGTAANPILIESSSVVSAATVAQGSGNGSMEFVALRGMTFSGGTSWTANNSLDMGSNSGITINDPVVGDGVVGVIGG
jgi:hypothetical protein